MSWSLIGTLGRLIRFEPGFSGACFAEFVCSVPLEPGRFLPGSLSANLRPKTLAFPACESFDVLLITFSILM